MSAGQRAAPRPTLPLSAKSTMTGESPGPTAPPWLVNEPRELARLAARCRDSLEIAVDVESNGLYAYRPKLCVLQLAWRTDDRVEVAVVDPLAVDVRPLGPALGEAGPPKLLHDLTFDAQLLRDEGVRLGRVRDTAIAARLLGEPATGLAALARSRLDLLLSKELQGHDWTLRPFGPRHLDYLSDDVRHLFSLAASLYEQARSLGILDEIAEECAYRLSVALRTPTPPPPVGQDGRPAHCRVKGYAGLDAHGRSVLGRLVEARERLAAQLNRPAFRIAPDRVLLDLARACPTERAAAVAACGRSAPAQQHVDHWVEAVRQGRRDGAAPPAEPRQDVPDPAERALRRRLRSALHRWRRTEADTRGIDVQAVLPGHCANDLVSTMVKWRQAEPSALRAAIAEIEGLGGKRVARYAAAWLAIAASQLHT